MLPTLSSPQPPTSQNYYKRSHSPAKSPRIGEGHPNEEPEFILVPILLAPIAFVELGNDNGVQFLDPQRCEFVQVVDLQVILPHRLGDGFSPLRLFDDLQ